MCATCGCSDDSSTHLTHFEAHAHPHHHGHDHVHGGHEHEDAHGGTHAHAHALEAEGGPRMVQLEQEVLARNDALAERNRAWFRERNILAVNLMSSPGAGKTTLLERTLRELGSKVPLSIIEGDQATVLDAERIHAAGGPVVQVNTGKGCHLDARMVAQSLEKLSPPSGSVVMIENVGNLVCPALFDLGERAKVVIASVTEGEDKPLKYPHVFRESALMLVNKIDLLPHLSFDLDRCIGWALRINPRLEVLEISATRGDGIAAWCDWLRARLV